MMLEVELPYPPSINHYWRRVGARTLISREGRRFRREVIAILAAMGVQPLADASSSASMSIHPIAAGAIWITSKNPCSTRSSMVARTAMTARS